MNNIEFFNSFTFEEFRFKHCHHSDNSQGINSHYFGFLKKGECSIISGADTLSISEGDLFYIPKDLKYHSYWQSKDIILFDSFGFKYLPDKQKYRLQKLNLDGTARNQLEELSQNKMISPYSVSLVYSLFSKLSPQMQPAQLTITDEITDKAIEIMQNNHQIKMTDLAKALAISESALFLAFKHSVNKTPNTVRQEICCRKAIDLLSTTDISVEKISNLTGFSSSSYFRKILFAFSGKTPRQIRNEVKKI